MNAKEALEEAKRRLRANAEGIEFTSNEAILLRQQLALCQQDRARLETELLAARLLVQTVGQNQNAATHDANQEAIRLRKLLKKHGIDPDSE